MKRIRSLLFAFFVLSFLGGAFAQNFAFNPLETHVLFRVKRAGVSYLFGRFEEITGSLTYDAANPANNKVELMVLTESISTGKVTGGDFDGARRDQDLKSPDFFDAAQFPTLSFVSKSVAATDDPNKLAVTGDLTIHGVTKEVTVTVEKTGEGADQQGNAMIGFYTEFTIDRTEFGMSNMLPVAPPEVLIMVSILGMAQ
jgi:polyisoprenoid-binding protein YceI